MAMQRRSHPLPMQAPAGALPAEPTIAEIEQEKVAPEQCAVLVEHNGPVMTHALPARAGAAFSMYVDTTSNFILGRDLRRQRAVLISTDQPFYYSARELSVVNSASAALWPINVPLVITHADSVYVACATASSHSTIAVITENFDGI